jgi:hypothetical protein
VQDGRLRRGRRSSAGMAELRRRRPSPLHAARRPPPPRAAPAPAPPPLSCAAPPPPSLPLSSAATAVREKGARVARVSGGGRGVLMGRP